ncbi:MAG TPA: DUF1801 domain-containing protein [Polyangiales bacterium]|nr:DUF1801 domain-containing protein [Polyangiales bacterium]
MAKHAFASIDEYLDSQPEPLRGLLEHVRDAIRQGIPSAEEAIAYNMPTFRQHGRAVLHFAGWKEHYSLYPATRRVVSVLRSELAPYEIENGAIRFPLSEPPPLALITSIAQLRAAEEEERSSSERPRRAVARK